MSDKLSNNPKVYGFCGNVDVISKVSSISCTDNENLESKICYFNQNEEHSIHLN